MAEIANWGTERITIAATNTQQAYEIPPNVRAIEFQALDADVGYYFVTGGSANRATIFQGNSKTFVDPNLAGGTIYFYGTINKIVEATWAKGTME